MAVPSRVWLSIHVSWPSSNKSHPSVGKPSEVTLVHFIKQLESCMSQEHISFVHWYEPIRQRHRFSALAGNLEISGDKQKFISVSVSLEMAHLSTGNRIMKEILKGNTQPWEKWEIIPSLLTIRNIYCCLLTGKPNRYGSWSELGRLCKEPILEFFCRPEVNDTRGTWKELQISHKNSEDGVWSFGLDCQFWITYLGTQILGRGWLLNWYPGWQGLWHQGSLTWQILCLILEMFFT